jgi:hypothetical protein
MSTSWQLLPVTVAPLGIWLVARSMALLRSQIDSAVTEPARAGAWPASSSPAPNAAPEWQAMNLRWPGGELVVACPLKGLVRSAQILSDLVNSFLVAEI